jgi:hypothetical protein
MPEIVTCPECDRKLSVPDRLLGKKVRCPDCRAMFVGKPAEEEDEPPAPVKKRRTAPPDDGIEDKPRAASRRSVEPPPEDEEDRPRSRRRDEEEEDDRPRRRRDEDDEDRPRSRRHQDDADEDRPRRRRDEDDEDYDDRVKPRDIRDAWRRVRTGLNLASLAGKIYAGSIIGWILSVMVVFCAGLIQAGRAPASAFDRPSGSGAGAIVFLVIILICYGLTALAALASCVVQLIGMGFCMVVPQVRGSSLKLLAIMSFCLLISGVVLSIPLTLVFFLAVFATSLVSVAGLVVFVFFMRSVALAAKDKVLAHDHVKFLIGWGIAVGTGIVGFVLAFFLLFGAAATGSRGGALVVSILMLIGILVAFGVAIGLSLWYARLAAETRDVVNRILRRT